MDSKVTNLLRFQNCPRHCKFYCMCTIRRVALNPWAVDMARISAVSCTQEELQQEALRRVEEAYEQERKKIHQESLERWRRRGELVTIFACCCFHLRTMLSIGVRLKIDS